jgi:hypothetical protein
VAADGPAVGGPTAGVRGHPRVRPDAVAAASKLDATDERQFPDGDK